MALFSMKNISKSFFGKCALNEVSFEVESGEIHALLGENGAGKTTLMNILYGIYTRDSGEIVWKGEPISFSSPKDAIERRIGMVHQHFMLVPSLTVSQNITLGLKSKGYPFSDRKELNVTIATISDKYGLHIDPEVYVSSLSVGEQQRVEIIKLLYRNAELLILDEPTAVLTPQETEGFFAMLRKLRDDGHSIILITHRLPEVMSITDRVTVLRDGRNIATVVTNEVNEQQLSNFMIGRKLKSVQRQTIPASDQEGLVLEDVSLQSDNRMLLDSISLDIAKGEIVGVAGVDGNGQKELAEVIIGIRRHSEGNIRLGDLDISQMTVLERRKLGIGYISDDRHNDGLILDMNLTENMLLKTHTESAFVKYGFIDKKLVRQNTQEAVEEYAIRTPSLETPVRYLSGGNQQKFILARELAGNPQAVVAFQPTRGLDIGASEFIRQKLLDYRSKGCSILLISADLEDILALSDRIAVIYKGKIMGVVANQKDLDISGIGLMMAGVSAERVSA
jgi:ABC-type uncharacterized transport system ATPase subunit